MPLRNYETADLPCALLIAHPCYGREISTIFDAGQPVPEGTKVEAFIAGKSFTGATDKSEPSCIAAEKVLDATVYYKTRSCRPFSFEKATRYDFTVETVDGKLTLKRK
jgi:hypothetical protein